MAQATSTPTSWRPIAGSSEHPLAGLVETTVGQGVRLVAEAGPRNRVGAERFRLFLDSDELGRTTLPVVTGLIDLAAASPAASGAPWIEVTGYRSRLPIEDGREVDVPEGILLQVVDALARLVPPGGSLVVEYESPALAITAQALAAGVPPIATPLGGMFFAAGCGSSFRVRDVAAGGRAGRRRLQGFRAASDVTEHQRGLAMLADLEAFMARSKELDWQVQSQTRPIAEATITALRARFEVPEGPLSPR